MIATSHQDALRILASLIENDLRNGGLALNQPISPSASSHRGRSKRVPHATIDNRVPYAKHRFPT